MTHAFPEIPGQSGLATRTQLLAAGWPDEAIAHWAVTVGQQPFPGVFASTNGMLSRRALLRAAALWARWPAVLTGLGALELRVWCRPGEARVFRFLVQAPAWCRSADPAHVVRSRRPPRAETVIDGIGIAEPARAVLDAARYREVGPTGARALAIRALQSGWVTATELRAEIKAGRRNGTRAIRLGLDDFLRGAWSLPEVRMEQVVREAGLPPILLNPTLKTLGGELIGVPDGYFEKAGVAVQVHSRQFHEGPDEDGTDRWVKTVEHDGDFAAFDIPVIGVAPAALEGAPQRFQHQVRTARLPRGTSPAARSGRAPGTWRHGRLNPPATIRSSPRLPPRDQCNGFPLPGGSALH